MKIARILLVALTACAAAAGPAAAADACSDNEFVLTLTLTDATSDCGGGAYQKNCTQQGKWTLTKVAKKGMVMNSSVDGAAEAKAITLPAGASACGKDFVFTLLLDTKHAKCRKGDTKEQSDCSDFGFDKLTVAARAAYVEGATTKANGGVSTDDAAKDDHLTVTVPARQLPGTIIVQDPKRKETEQIAVAVAD